MAQKKHPLSSISSTDILIQWQQDLEADHALSTIRRYIAIIRHFVAWYEQNEHQAFQPENLTPITLVSYRNSLQKVQTASTVNTHVCALRKWSAWLAEHHFIDTNPALRLKQVERQALAAPEPLKDNQIHALLRAASRSRHPQRNNAILQVLLQTGIRIGECAALQWGDIQLSERQGLLTVRAGKGNKTRIVPLNATVRQALVEYVASSWEVEATIKEVNSVWPTSSSTQGDTFVWSSQKNVQLSLSAMQRMIDGLVRDCAARNLVPSATSAHTLRHTFARYYLAANPGDLAGLASLLGHNSLNTTRIYIQPTFSDLAVRTERLDLNAYTG